VTGEQMRRAIYRDNVVVRIDESVLTPMQKTKWREFTRELAKLLKLAPPKAPGEKFTNKCDHTLRRARKLLRQQQFHVGSSLAYFRQHGGFCDCEIIWNVEASVYGRGRRGRPKS